MTVRVLVVDDQALVRAGFRMILEAEADLDVVGEAIDGREAVNEALRLRPDVVLMDVRMPRMDGIEATRRLLAADAEAKVLMLTTFDMDEYVYGALRAGAAGFLLKSVDAARLVVSNQQIAHRLGVGEATVKTHVSRVLTKLDLRSRVQAAVLAKDAGLVR